MLGMVSSIANILRVKLCPALPQVVEVVTSRMG